MQQEGQCPRALRPENVRGFDGSDDSWRACNEVIERCLKSFRLQDADREDCRQEIWMKILRTTLPSLPGPLLCSWTKKLAKNRIVDFLRCNRRHHHDIINTYELTFFTSYDDDFVPCPSILARKVVWEALAKLEGRTTPMSFLTFYLHWLEGWSFREIAEIFGLSEGQARLRAFRVKLAYAELL